MTLDLDKTLDRIKRRQWALADFDWDQPGAELITDEQRPKLAAFMADLVWIEQVGARGFAALARQATDPTLVEIYRWFHAEEQRHANAELALMRRWGMLEDGKTPPPNNNIRLVIAWLDRFGDDLPLASLGSIIPLLEVALDGALLKFLLDEVHDPLCHAVFERINNDESRHLAVDFHVLAMIGEQSGGRDPFRILRILSRPGILTGIPIGLPLFTKMKNNLVEMGLDETQLYAAVERYGQLAARDANATKNVQFNVLHEFGDVLIAEEGWFKALSSILIRLTDGIPQQAFGKPPIWIEQLTYEPVA